MPDETTTTAATAAEEYEPVDRSGATGRPLSDALVMFGASGDLARKKLFPAVYRLHRRGMCDIPVVGVALDDWTDDDMRHRAEESIREEGEEWDAESFAQLAANMHFVSGNYADPATFEKVKVAVRGAQHPVFHLAIPPSMFQSVAEGIAAVGLNQGSRLIIEKPFGRDLESALELNGALHAHFSESAIFRIDHFLGKEALRSLLITRFANAVLEPLWNRAYVSHIKITMAEEFGVEDRGGFYDSVGALRDVMQNHLLQMVALFAMEQPVNESAKALRDEKAKVLMAARPIDPAHYVRGQYDGYLDVPGVKPGSDTETYGAFRLDFDSPRWGRVPFFLRAGKAMKETVTEMTIEFQRPPRPLWLDDRSSHTDNMFRIEVKPDNFAAMTWNQKRPGDGMIAEPITLAPPPDQRGDTGPEPYELLLHEAMLGDPTLFAREDSIEESWRIVEPVLRTFPPVAPYRVGSWGPKPASALVAHNGGWPEEPRVTDLGPPAETVRGVQPIHETGQHEVFVIRHGATEWSRNGRHTGLTDIPLLPEGEEQAVKVGELLHGRPFGLVLVSPLGRARETCELAGYLGEAEVTDDLLEWDYGDYEGVTSRTIRETVPGWTIWDDPVPGGETVEQVAARVDRVIARLRAVDADTAVFAHGHVLRVLAARWCEMDPREGKRLPLETATLNVLGWEHEYPTIRVWNQR